MGYALTSMRGLIACPFCREMFEPGEATACPVCGMKLERVEKLASAPTGEIVIEVPTRVLNDCAKIQMFSVWTASKRLKIKLPEPGMVKRVSLLFSLLDAYELEMLPLSKNLRPRSLGVYARRWREAVEAARRERQIIAVAGQDAGERRPDPRRGPRHQRGTACRPSRSRAPGRRARHQSERGGSLRTQRKLLFTVRAGERRGRHVARGGHLGDLRGGQQLAPLDDAQERVQAAFGRREGLHGPPRRRSPGRQRP